MTGMIPEFKLTLFFLLWIHSGIHALRQEVWQGATVQALQLPFKVAFPNCLLDWHTTGQRDDLHVKSLKEVISGKVDPLLKSGN